MMEMLFSIYRYFGALFTSELLICSVIFCHKFPRRKKFAVRAVSAVVLYVILSVLLTFLFFIETENSAILSVVQICYYALLWICLIAGIAICFNVGAVVAFAAGIGAYAAQHLSYSMFSLFYFLFFDYVRDDWYIVYELTFCVLVAIAVWFVLFRKNDYTDKSRISDFRFLPLSALTFFSCIVINTVVDRYGRDVALMWEMCRFYAILCCVLLLLVVFGLSREDSLKREKEVTEILLHYEKEQHKIRTESVDIINMKCHDLKHQLLLLQKASDKATHAEIYDEVVAAVDGFYDTGVKTGNDTLDLILSEQLMRCHNLGIALDCSADGSALSFMKNSDIFALFGNALDNAVDAVRVLPEVRRWIRCSVKSRSGMTYIHIENDCGEGVAFNTAGMPLTDKPDKEVHGFGVKSIFYIANRYGGTAKTYIKDGKFHLEILFVFDDTTKKSKITTE